jgi:hypothetical protein
MGHGLSVFPDEVRGAKRREVCSAVHSRDKIYRDKCLKIAEQVCGEAASLWKHEVPNVFGKSELHAA